MMNMKRRLSLALALMLAMALIAPAAAAETAAAIQLTKTAGTVSITKSNGKSVSLREGMRLYNGYNVTTAAESYAWISLDSTKLMKLDESSSVEVRKNGSKLEVNVKSGSVSFNVTQTLNSNESLNVSSSTMAVGIRGTFGWVRVTDQWVTEVCLLEGSSQCVVADPVTCQLKSAQLEGGDEAECVVYPQDRQGDKCDILMKRQTVEGIPGFVLTELVQDVPLCDKILADSGLDVLRGLAETAGGDPSGRTPDGGSATPEILWEAERRLRLEEEEQIRKLEEIRKRLEEQENNISQEGVWKQDDQEQPDNPSASFNWPDWSGVPSGGTPEPAAPSGPQTYTITLDGNNGPVALSEASVTTDAEGKAALPTIDYTPNTDGTLAFDGWFTQPSGGTQVTDDTVFTSDQTVYAQWSGWDWELLDNETGKTLRIFGTGSTGSFGSKTQRDFRLSLYKFLNAAKS